MNRQEILDTIEHLPEEIDPEQLMGELYLRAKLDRAEAAVARGEVVSHEEVVQRSRQWFE
jgi:predicted transcriptional regulator